MKWVTAMRYPWFDGGDFDAKSKLWEWLVEQYDLDKICSCYLSVTDAVKSITHSRIIRRSEGYDGFPPTALDHMRMAKTKEGKYVLIYAPYDGGEPESAERYFRSIGLRVKSYQPSAYLPSSRDNSTIVVCL